MKKGFLKKIFTITLVGVMGSSLVACGSKEDKLTAIKEKGELVVGLSADYAPYEFHILDENGDDQIVGFDVEIAKEIAKDLGVKLTLQDMNFENLVGGVSTGKIDLAISGMTPNEKRKKSIDFSDIYYTSEHGILVRAEDKDKYKTFADLKGQKVGAQMGAIQAKIAEENVEDGEVQLLSNVNDLIMSLKSGKIEALVVELAVAEMIVQNNPELVIAEEKVKDETGGSAVGIQKGQEALVEQINTTINRIKEEGLLSQFIIDANDLAGKQN